MTHLCGRERFRPLLFSVSVLSRAHEQQFIEAVAEKADPDTGYGEAGYAVYQQQSAHLEVFPETAQKIATALGVPIWQLFASPSEITGNGKIIRCPECQHEFEVELRIKEK